MKVTLEIPDATFAAKSLNNATVAYSQIVAEITLGVYAGSRFERLYDVPEADLKQQLSCLISILNQLDEISSRTEAVPHES